MAYHASVWKRGKAGGRIYYIFFNPRNDISDRIMTAICIKKNIVVSMCR